MQCVISQKLLLLCMLYHISGHPQDCTCTCMHSHNKCAHITFYSAGDKISNLHDLLQAVKSIGNWRGLCTNLKVDGGEMDKLVYSNTNIDDKKMDCLQAYFNTGEAKWSEVVKAVAKSPINNRRIAKQIANEYGVHFKDELW